MADVLANKSHVPCPGAPLHLKIQPKKEKLDGAVVVHKLFHVRAFNVTSTGIRFFGEKIEDLRHIYTLRFLH